MYFYTVHADNLTHKCPPPHKGYSCSGCICVIYKTTKKLDKPRDSHSIMLQKPQWRHLKYSSVLILIKQSILILWKAPNDDQTLSDFIIGLDWKRSCIFPDMKMKMST